MYLYDALKKSEESFKKSILEYLNKAKKPLNEPEIITVVITDKIPHVVRTFISYVFKKIFKNWRDEKYIPKEMEKYYVEPIQNLFSLLTDSTILSKVQSQIIFRAHFDINLEKGGLWVGEFIPHKSLFIPHILLTDYYYKNQYLYLIWDMILYCYTKNFMRINIGGSEEQDLFNIKKAPEAVLGNKVKERKLYTLYIPSNRNNKRL
jgi:CRISPR/Cas system CMR subunit Cmr4 (Cas7 group RAMP superfamily)